MAVVPRESSVPQGDGTPIAEPVDHSLFWYFIVIGIELAVLAGLLVVTRYTVQYRSGLNEPDKIRRIWARAPEIRFQPVMRPLIFAIAVSYGAQTVLHATAVALLTIVNITNGLVSIGLSIISVGLSSLISILVYRATGGTNWKICAAATFGFDLFISGVLLNLALGMYQSIDIGSGFVNFLVIVFFYSIVLSVLQVPFYIWGAYHRLPATARLIYNSSVVPNWVKLDRTILVAAGPLAALYVVAYLAEFSLRCDTYLSNLTIALAALMLLAGASISAIISVNRALLANEFQWQWRAFLTPAIPLGAFKVVIILLRIVTGKLGFLYGVYEAIHFFLSIGGCGTLGAYTYLILAEKYAQAHIDDDMLAQDDLLAEFEEEEDNEELDV